MWVQSTCASSATSASTSTDMWRTDGYLLRFEPCVLPKMSLFPCHHVVSDCVCVQRTLWFQTPFYCYCAHECATPQFRCIVNTKENWFQLELLPVGQLACCLFSPYPTCLTYTSMRGRLNSICKMRSFGLRYRYS